MFTFVVKSIRLQSPTQPPSACESPMTSAIPSIYALFVRTDRRSSRYGAISNDITEAYDCVTVVVMNTRNRRPGERTSSVCLEHINSQTNSKIETFVHCWSSDFNNLKQHLLNCVEYSPSRWSNGGWDIKVDEYDSMAIAPFQDDRRVVLSWS